MISLNNLAIVHSQRGQFALATPLLKEALQVTVKVNGENHANTAECLFNLAIAVPNLWDLARCSTGVLSDALPMTPIFSRMAFAGVLAVEESTGVSEENIAWFP